MVATDSAKGNRTSEAYKSLVDDIRPLFADDQIVELRALKVKARYGKPHTVSGYFDADHRAEMVAEAMNLTADAKGVYFTANPVNPDLLARRCNRVDRVDEGETTSDKNIVCRRWLPIDIDPIRDSQISASADEKAKARELTEDIHVYLSERGFPAPIFVDSGNGFHLLYRIDMPANDGGIVEHVIKALAARFDNEHAKVDQSVYNPAQILKLPGTWARKGDSTRIRPHRQSTILEMPIIEIVPQTLLETLASEAPKEKSKKTTTTSPNGDGHKGNGDGHKSGWNYTATGGADARHSAYGRVVLKAECEKVLAAADNTKHVTLRDAAFCCGHRIPLYFSYADAESALRDAIGRRGAADMDLAWRTIASGLKKGMESPDPPLGEKSDTSDTRSDAGRKHTENASKTGGASDCRTVGPKRPIPEYTPFPVDALPEPMRRFIVEGAEATGCDESFFAIPALTVAAGLVGTARYVRLKNRTWKEPAVIWAVTVADPSSIKSPPFKMVQWPLIALQKKAYAEYADAYNRYEKELEEWKGKDEKERTAEPPEKPKKREYFGTDMTIERVAEILVDNPRGALQMRDEISAWFGSFTRYKGKGVSSDVPHWLELWSAGVLKIHRKMAVPRDIFVPHAVASVCGTIQPGTLARCMSSDMFDAGTPFRFLFAMPPRRQKEWRDVELSEEAECIWEHCCERLAHLPGEMVLSLSKEAKALWVDFYNQGGIAQFNATGHIQAALGKLEAYAARLALVHYLVDCSAGIDHPANGPIPAESMAAGIKLVNWFANEAERVFMAIEESDDERELRRLAEKIASKGGTISVRTLQNSNSKRYRRAADAEAHLDLLVEAGFGEWQGEGSSRVFVLVRQSDKSDT